MGNSLHMCFGGPKEGDDTSQRSPMQDSDERDAGAHGKKHKRLSLCADRPMPDDFVWGANLGTGAFAKVVHARVKSAAARAKLRLPADASDDFAIKVMDKQDVVRANKMKYVMSERDCLARLLHPHVVALALTFQDECFLYFCFELATGGTLLDVVQRARAAAEPARALAPADAAFYAAELALALRHCHVSEIIHRDLKPENVLVMADGHLKLTDFGTARDERKARAAAAAGDADAERADSFVGTAEYLSPEVMAGEPATRAADLWSFGVIIFQLITGLAGPFSRDSPVATLRAIEWYDDGATWFGDDGDGAEDDDDDACAAAARAAARSLPVSARALVGALLRIAPHERLGVRAAGAVGDGDVREAYVELARHAFFGGLLARAMPPGGGDELANAKLAAEPPFKPGANTHLVRKSKMQSHAKKRLSLMVA